jgi:DNA-binding FadR family transcriptional regulator
VTEDRSRSSLPKVRDRSGDAARGGSSTVNGSQGERAPRASESVASKLRIEILSGSMPAGSKFPPEVELAAEYGVSRPTIREALRFLESDHLISIRRGKQGGAVVEPPSTSVLARHAGLLLEYRGATLADVLAAKALIEPPAAGAVARRRDPEAVRQLRELIELEAEHQGNDQLVQQLGEQFHDLLVELAGNRTLRIYAAMINGIITRHMSRLGTTTLEYRARLLDEHRRLVELIEVGAALEAEASWRQHLEHFTDRLLSDVPRGTTVLDLMS